jgi:hypothetical protein
MEAGLIDDPDKPRSLSEAIRFVGTCAEMCPEFEMHQREYQNNVEKWEIVFPESLPAAENARIQLLVELINHEPSRHFIAQPQATSSPFPLTFDRRSFLL